MHLEFSILGLKSIAIILFQIGSEHCLPFLAGDPPTTREVCVAEKPQPSAGLSKRPMIFGFAGPNGSPKKGSILIGGKYPS